jgi:hypothetical protein
MIAQTRLEHQAAQIQRGEKPDNFMAPGDLSDFERSHLRDAFVVIKTMQNAAGSTGGILNKGADRPMFWALITALVAGFAGAGIGLGLRALTRKRLPLGVIPVSAGIAMIVATVATEYGWYPNVLRTMAPDLVVISQREQQAWYQPWTFVHALGARVHRLFPVRDAGNRRGFGHLRGADPHAGALAAPDRAAEPRRLRRKPPRRDRAGYRI